MLQDLQIACRRVLRAPGFSLTVIAILALGVGAVTAMVSVLDVLLWRPIPVVRPHELIGVASLTPEGVRRLTPLATLDALAAADVPVDGWCGYSGTLMPPTEAGSNIMQASVDTMSGQCFRTMGVAPLLGRWIEKDDAPVKGAGKPVAVISHRFWQRMFGGDPNVLGRTLRIDTGTVSIIGVMPQGFSAFQKDIAPDVIVPFNSYRPTPNPNVVYFVGRLRPGHTADSVRPQLAGIWPAILASAPAQPGTASTAPPAANAVEVQSLTAGLSTFRRLYAPALTAATGLAGVLLLLTCVNVGGLLVARVAAHTTELSVMRSLGATSGRIASQLLAECLMLALLGCALGMGFAYAASAAFVSLFPWGNIPWTIELTPDLRITAGVAALSVVVALVIAAVPMWMAVRNTTQLRSHRTVTRTSSRWGNALLVGQLAATVVLVFACSLIVRSYTTLLNTDRGFRHSDRILSVRLTPNPGGYQNLDQVSYYPALVARAAALPGVESAGFARYFGTINAQLTPQPVAFAGSAEGTTGAMEFISPGFFDTVGIPLLAGRDVAWSDQPSTPRVVIVSESLARALTPNGDVVGKVISFGMTPAMQRLQIVGVVGNISVGNYRQNSVRLVFAPAIQSGDSTFATLHLRTAGDPLALARPATEVVRSLGREHAQRATRVDFLFSNGIVPERMGAVVSTAAAAVAVILSCLGVYALLTHSIARRTREIGIRMAVGASPAAVRGLIARHVMALVSAGLAIGVPAAIAAASALRSLLYGVTTTDGVALAACGALLLVTCVVAAAWPTRRALRIDPASSLRAE